MSGDGLSKEERELYNSLIRLLSEYEVRVMKPEGSQKAAGGAKGEKSVRFRTDVPAFVGSSDEKLGPYSSGQVVALSGDDAKLLIEQGVAEEA